MPAVTATTVMVAAGMPRAALAADPESSVGPGSLVFAAVLGLVLIGSSCWWGARRIYRSRKSIAFAIS